LKARASTIILDFDMKKFLLTLLFSTSVFAQENITVYTPYSASHGGNAAFQRVLDRANEIQKDYRFQFELRPGAQGLIALKAAAEQPENRLSVIHAAFVELIEKSQIQETDWRPVHAIGEACWAVVTLGGNESQGIASLKSVPEITVGTVGVGNVTHLTSLAIGERVGVPVRLVLFKSNYDALINLLGNHGVNFAIERYAVVEQFREKNPKIQVVGMSCPTRYAAMHVATLREQGLNLPGVVNIVMAHQKMPADRQQAIGRILDQATKDVGLKEIQHLSDMRSPVFDNVNAQQFYQTRINALKTLRKQYVKQIQASRD
jgi:tripartite-type tricarboxylate transporter receptor subunit TctC